MDGTAHQRGALNHRARVCFTAAAPAFQGLLQEAGPILQFCLLRQQFADDSLKFLHPCVQLNKLGLLALPESPLSLQKVA